MTYSPNKISKLFIVCFILMNILLCSFFMDSGTVWDMTSRVLPVITLSESGTLKVDEYHQHTQAKSKVNGHYYSDKAPLASFLVVPFYKLFSPLLKDNADFRSKSRLASTLGNMICSSIPLAIIILITFFYTQHSNTSKVSAILLSTFPFYGSLMFVYSGTFFAHILGGLFLLASYIFLKERNDYLVSGLFGGLAFLSEYPLGVILPIWGCLIFFTTRSYKKTLLFLVGFTPSLLFIAWYNWHTTGSSFQFLYQFLVMSEFADSKANLGFSYPKIAALYGMLISTYRGLLFGFPFCVLLIITALRTKIKVRVLFGYISVAFIAHLVLIASHDEWWGGDRYGARHLIPFIVLVAFEGIRFLAKNRFSKRLFWLVMSLSLLVHWVIKSTISFAANEQFENPIIDLAFPLFLREAFNSNNLPTLLFGLSPAQSVYLWLVMFIFSMIGFEKWHKSLCSNNN